MVLEEVPWEHLKAPYVLLLQGTLSYQPESTTEVIFQKPILQKLDCLIFILVKIGLCWFEVHLAYSRALILYIFTLAHMY